MQSPFIKMVLEWDGGKMAKFKCVECGENEVDDEDDICDECFENEQSGFENSDGEDEFPGDYAENGGL